METTVSLLIQTVFLIKYTKKIINALGKPKLVINNILPNPDYKNLKEILLNNFQKSVKYKICYCFRWRIENRYR